MKKQLVEKPSGKPIRGLSRRRQITTRPRHHIDVQHNSLVSVQKPPVIDVRVLKILIESGLSKADLDLILIKEAAVTPIEIHKKGSLGKLFSPFKSKKDGLVALRLEINRPKKFRLSGPNGIQKEVESVKRALAEVEQLYRKNNGSQVVASLYAFRDVFQGQENRKFPLCDDLDLEGHLFYVGENNALSFRVAGVSRVFHISEPGIANARVQCVLPMGVSTNADLTRRTPVRIQEMEVDPLCFLPQLVTGNIKTALEQMFVDFVDLGLVDRTLITIDYNYSDYGCNTPMERKVPSQTLTIENLFNNLLQISNGVRRPIKGRSQLAGLINANNGNNPALYIDGKGLYIKDKTPLGVAKLAEQLLRKELEVKHAKLSKQILIISELVYRQTAKEMRAAGRKFDPTTLFATIFSMYRSFAGMAVDKYHSSIILELKRFASYQ